MTDQPELLNKAEVIAALEDCYVTPDNDREEGMHDGVTACIEAIQALEARPAPAVAVKPEILSIIRTCLSFTDKCAGEGVIVDHADPHDFLTIFWESQGWDVNGPEWVDDVLSALSPQPPLAPQDAAKVLLEKLDEMRNRGDVGDLHQRKAGTDSVEYFLSYVAGGSDHE